MSAECESSFSGFRKLAAFPVPPAALDDWTLRHLHQLAELEAGWADYGPEDCLVHCDMRADNLLIRPDDTMVMVDWPWACAGPSWVDFAAMLPSVGMDGGPSPRFVESQLDPFAGVDPNQVSGFIAGLAGYFTFSALQPEPDGLTGLRTFQHRQGKVARAWLQHRLDHSAR
jgi:aminoglycoside phosphotransferase (APT) family kinase protein